MVSKRYHNSNTMRLPFKLFGGTLLCLLTVIVQNEASPMHKLYKIPERRVEQLPRRANAETLTFSGDVDKIIEMANNLGRDKADAAANAGAVQVGNGDGGAGSEGGGDTEETGSDPLNLDGTTTLESSTHSPAGMGEEDKTNPCPTQSPTPDEATVLHDGPNAPTPIPTPATGTTSPPNNSSPQITQTVAPETTNAPLPTPTGSGGTPTGSGGMPTGSGGTPTGTQAPATPGPSPTESPETLVDIPPAETTKNPEPTLTPTALDSSLFEVEILPAATKSPTVQAPAPAPAPTKSPTVQAPAPAPSVSSATPVPLDESELPIVTDEDATQSEHSTNPPQTSQSDNGPPQSTGVPAVSEPAPVSTPSGNPSSPTPPTTSTSPVQAPDGEGNDNTTPSTTNDDNSNAGTAPQPTATTGTTPASEPTSNANTAPTSIGSGSSAPQPTNTDNSGPNNESPPSASSSVSPNESPAMSPSGAPTTGQGSLPTATSNQSPVMSPSSAPANGGGGPLPTSSSPNQSPVVSPSTLIPNAEYPTMDGDSGAMQTEAPGAGQGEGEQSPVMSPSSWSPTFIEPTQLGSSEVSPTEAQEETSGEPSPAISPSVSSPTESENIELSPTINQEEETTPEDEETAPESTSNSGTEGPSPTNNASNATMKPNETSEPSPSATGEAPTNDNQPTGQPASSPNDSGSGILFPGTSQDTLIACDGSSLERPEMIEFSYSLETATTDSQVIEDIRRSTEQVLSKDAANLLLPCDARRLQTGNAVGFEGIDHEPADSSSANAQCTPSVDIENQCTVIDGILTVYISQQADFELAKYYTLTAIRQALGLVDNQVTGLVKAVYLGPDIANPAAFGTSEIDAGDIATGPDNINTSLVLFAVGGCAFAASVGLIYYLRRHGSGNSGAATQAAGSDQQTGQYDAERPLSPFSEMLPSAYRFDQDGNMSAILELDDESGTQRSGIIVSDSGFTTEEEGSIAISMDGTASLNRADSPVLGARKRHDGSSLLNMKGMVALSLVCLVLPVEGQLRAAHTVVRGTNETHQQDLPMVRIIPKEERRLETVVSYGGTPRKRHMPLNLCEGDCDYDSDCAAGLKCFQRRRGREPVPGCEGGERVRAGTDFCIRAGLSHESVTTMDRRTMGGGGKFGRCEGDCDKDSDCQSGLVCKQRKKGDPAPIQCPNIDTTSQKDYCVDPDDREGTAPRTSIIPVPTPTSTAPGPTPGGIGRQQYTGSGLGLCEGDCDHDDDCKNGLICYQRQKYDPIPHGCSGSKSTQKDYCVDPNSLLLNEEQDNDSDTISSTNPFRLKLYWQEGYKWQDEDFERKWCVMRDFDGYPGRGKCWYGLDTSPCNPDHAYIAKCNDDERQQWVFEFVNDNEALIKVAGQNRCMERSGALIVLRQCNSSNVYQRFFAIRGAFNEYRFEISQKSATRYCLNQAHHPKPGEVIAMYPCSRTRSEEHMTSWWELY